jgi:hypothetical protein
LGGYGASRSCCSRSWARQDFPSEYHTILRDSVTAWDLGGAAAERIGDLSDVTVGPDGRIYVLSDESRCIARLQATLDPEDRLIEVDRIWGLPERLHQPEGLVITGDWEVLVAVDHPEPRQNLFQLRGLDT